MKISAPSAKQTFLNKFEQRQRDEGLVDMKFFRGKVTHRLPESFCKEANEIDTAIDRGRYYPVFE